MSLSIPFSTSGSKNTFFSVGKAAIWKHDISLKIYANFGFPLPETHVFDYSTFVLSLINHIFKLTFIYVFICLWIPFWHLPQLLGVIFYLHLRSKGFAASVEFSTRFLKFYLLYLALSGFVLYICLCAYYLSLPFPSASKSRKAGSCCLIAISLAPRKCSNMRKERKRWGWGGEIAVGALDHIGYGKYSFSLTDLGNLFNTVTSTSWVMMRNWNLCQIKC